MTAALAIDLAFDPKPIAPVLAWPGRIHRPDVFSSATATEVNEATDRRVSVR